MDDKLFKEKLTEFTEWEIPKVANGSGRKPEPEDEANLEEDQKIMLPDGSNKTVGPKIIRLKPIVKNCEDCGASCVDRRVEYKYNETHDSWRSQCMVCKLWRHPITGEYTLNTYELQSLSAGLRRARTAKRSKYRVE